jgi:hypothetical protein
LFQYASEAIDTGIAAVDAFETLKTFNTNTTRNHTGEVKSITITANGSGYTSAPEVAFLSSTGAGAIGQAVISNGRVTSVNIINPGAGYQTAPVVSFVGGGGSGAQGEANIEINIDKADSFGDNNKFKEQSSTVINFDESNPFGEINNA